MPDPAHQRVQDLLHDLRRSPARRAAEAAVAKKTALKPFVEKHVEGEMLGLEQPTYSSNPPPS